MTTTAQTNGGGVRSMLRTGEQIGTAVFASAMLLLIIVFTLVYVMTVPSIEKAVAALIREEQAELGAIYDIDGAPGLTAAVERRASISGRTGRYYILLGPNRATLAGNLFNWPGLVPTDGELHRVTIIRGPSLPPVEIGAIAQLYGQSRYALLIGQDLREREALERGVLLAFVAAAFVTLGFGFIANVVVSGFMLRRVESVALTAREIVRGDLTQRIEVRGRSDEFDALSTTFNLMLDRIEELMLSMRAVTDSIAHDFRTQLGRARARAEAALAAGHDTVLLRSTLATIESEIDRMQQTLNSLLEIARAEAGLSREQMQTVDLTQIAENVVELYQPIAEEAGTRVEIEASGPVLVHAHANLLTQALANLVENALKYGGVVHPVLIEVQGAATAPAVAVADRGPGIPEADRERVLERFVRLDPARGTPGSGLGLSLVAAVARLHDARLILLDNRPGLRVVLRFPRPARP